MFEFAEVIYSTYSYGYRIQNELRPMKTKDGS